MINRGGGVISCGKDDCQKHDNSIQMYKSSVKMHIRRNNRLSLQLQVSWIDFQIALLPQISLGSLTFQTAKLPHEVM